MQSLTCFRKPDSDFTLGIEWELCLYDDYSKARIRDGDYMGFFYVTTDGSIAGARRGAGWYGRELVSQPLPAAWLIKELDRLSKKLPQVDVNETCGIHIHVSRKWATKKKIKYLEDFFKTLTDHEMCDAFGRKPNYYCRRVEHVEAGNRYRSINVTNKHTVEFRMFSSGNVKWAQYCVKLVDYMMRQCKTLNKDAFFAFVDMHKPE